MVDEKNFEELATKEDLKKLITKDEFKTFKDENFNRLDEITVILKRLDQERIFTYEIVKRLEREVENNKKEINIIKAKLKIA